MKNFYVQYGVGKSKYLVNFHDGEKKHPDGSNFYDVRLFNSVRKFRAFILSLLDEGYEERIRI
jgi:hypothetical protein